jgi:hypothetical protein
MALNKYKSDYEPRGRRFDSSADYGADIFAIRTLLNAVICTANILRKPVRLYGVGA